MHRQGARGRGGGGDVRGRASTGVGRGGRIDSATGLRLRRLEPQSVVVPESTAAGVVAAVGVDCALCS